MNQSAIKKIKSISELTKIIDYLKKKGKTIVQCHGVFDLIHLGHIRHFNLAKKEGDILIVTITNDQHVKRGPGRPIFNENLRAETLASLAITDYVGIIDAPTATHSIKLLKPNVYAKGIDYKQKEKDVTGKIYEEEGAIKSVGGRLVFTDDITFSSSKLINNYLDVFPQRTLKYLKAISKRYSIDFITEKLHSLKKLKVLVIGDAIVDQYHYCAPMGKSTKEDIISNKFISEESFAGGSLATANHVSGICGRVDLITALGKNDAFGDFIKNKLNPNINPIFFNRSDASTIIKRRFVTPGINRKLFEICYLKDEYINTDD